MMGIEDEEGEGGGELEDEGRDGGSGRGWRKGHPYP